MRKPFFDGGYAGSTPRMSVEDLQEGMAWVDDRFFPIRYEDEALPSVDWVLNVAKAAVLRSHSLTIHEPKHLHGLFFGAHILLFL